MTNTTNDQAKLKKELDKSKLKNRLYQNLFDNLNIGILVVARNQIIAANNKSLHILGFTLDELFEKDVNAIFPLLQPDGRKSITIIDNAFKSINLIDAELTNFQLLNKHKEEINCNVLVHTLILDGEKYIQLEITEVLTKQELSQRLREKNKQIETLSEERESLNEELRATLDELVEVNKQLAESEFWNKSIVDNMPLGLHVINDGITEHINEKYLDIAGFDYDELIKKSIYDLALPEEHEKIRLFYSEFNKSSNSESAIDYWIKDSRGQKKYVRNQFVKLSKEGRLMILISDLTESKLKEIEISNIRDRLEFAIEAGEINIWDIDLVGHNQLYSQSHGKVFGRHSEYVTIGEKMWELMVHPEDLPEVKKKFAEHFRKQTKYFETECRIQNKDNTYKWMLVRGKIASMDKNNMPQKYIGMFIDISSRKQTEEKLAVSEEKFRTIVQQLSDIIFIIDENLTILYESPSVSKTFGFETGHFLGKNGLSIVHRDEVNMAKKEFERLLQHNNTDFKPIELRISHKEGYWVTLEVLGNNLIAHPAIKGILLTARDISERKENEKQLELYSNHLEKLVKKRTEEIENINAELIAINEELKAANEELYYKNEKLNEEIKIRIETQLMLEESENKFRSFIEQSTEGIVLIDEQGRIVDWNKGMQSIFRIAKEDVINTYIWEFDYKFLPDKRKTAQQFEELKNSTIEYFSNLDKSKVMTVEGIYQNIELKQKHLNVTIFPVITPKRRYLGRITRDVTYIHRAQEEIEKQSEELLQINQNLEEQKVQLEKALVELRKTQGQLIHSEKMASLGVLTAGVAHEINNPVNYINTALEGLKITLNDLFQIFEQYDLLSIENSAEKLKEIEQLKTELDYPMLQDGVKILLNNMQTGIARITEIVRSLRTFARIDENELRYSNIHELIDTTLVMLHNQYKNRIEIVKDYCCFQNLNCYSGKLSQVFMNILSNAIQAIPEKGTIFITTKVNKEKEEFFISIRDTGIGMPAYLKEKIFEPFFTTKEAGKGTGLGLSITYGIIQQHHGHIEVNSKQGQGTEFIITIPTNLK
ncbi:MAG TPA: PAS domain S-box protein [Bacteroidales bacterium]